MGVYILLVVILLLATVGLYLFPTVTYPQKTLPWVNKSTIFDLQYSKAKTRYSSDAPNLIKSGLSKGSAFNVITDLGYFTFLDSKFANELRSHPNVSFSHAISTDFHAYIHGFEPFISHDGVVAHATRTKLTHRLAVISTELSEETKLVLEEIWTNRTDWHTVNSKKTVLPMVAQLSSKIFTGEEICRDPRWISITGEYVVNSFIAAKELHRWPAPLRPFAARWLKSCCKVRDGLREAEQIINPVVERRRKERKEAIREGKPPKIYMDALEWMEEYAEDRPYNPTYYQLALSFASMHTMTDLLMQALYDVCAQPKIIEALRKEIVTVVEQEGWRKTTLYKLKLMDSFLKESQRLKPQGLDTMRREVRESFALSDGTLLPKGTQISVSRDLHWDPIFYPNPETFDAYRFLRMRTDSNHEAQAQFVAATPHHMGFGFGKHACPGRFFAATQLKIMLCHILLKYDFKILDGTIPPPLRIGASLHANPLGMLSIRRRQEELVL